MLVVALVEHYETLVGRLRRRFGDHEAAQDVVHDICVRLLSVPPVQGVRSPEAFLRRMTADLAIDRHRVASGRSRLLAEAGNDPSLPELCGGPEAAIEHDQMLDAIFRVVDRLPARCRDVFVLHKLHGVPQEEIAARLGISRNMVARHMMRARQDLELLLAEDGCP